MIIVKIFGGLGNQMFQYAFFKSMQKKGKKVKLDITEYKSSSHHGGLMLTDTFGISLAPHIASEKEIKNLKGFSPFGKFNIIYLNKIIYKFQIFFYKILLKIENEKFFLEHKFFEEIYSLEKGYLVGFWQSEKYFKEIEKEIRKEFSFNLDKLDNKNFEILNKIKKLNTVSLHIRRGDYLKNASLGNVCDLNYFKRSIKFVEEKIEDPLFIIFSDDIEWCKENLKKENIVYIDWKNKPEIDMYLMKNCKHNIISNSTFSWWAAWLNENRKKIVIMPQKWFNDKETDIYIENWCKI